MGRALFRGSLTMIDPSDKQTQSLPLDDLPLKKRRGRPPKAGAKTNAERQADYRARQKARMAELEGLLRSGVLPPVIDRHEDLAALSALDNPSRARRVKGTTASRSRAPQGRGPGEDREAQPTP